jgi:hypothetical protein
MNKTRAIIRIRLKTSICNIVVKNGCVGRWCFNWENNLITAYMYINYNIQSQSDIFEQTRTIGDLALLIDVLTLVTNQDVNTSVSISTDPIIDSFTGQITYRSKSADQFLMEIRSLKHESNARCINGNDTQRIDNSTLQLSNKSLNTIDTLLSRLSLINKYPKELKKLINYWRKGVDLDHLQFVEESYLSFYKIIEYISKSANLSDKDIPTKYHLNPSLKTAYKFTVGAKLKKTTKAQYKMLSEFIDIRNNWDIAHAKIRPLPDNDAGGLYYSYMGHVWDYHRHICQITRMTLLGKSGLTGLSLENDGGLYCLRVE